jgi:hypothetical protein
MLPSHSLFQPFDRVFLRGSHSGGLPGRIATVGAPLPLARFLKNTVLPEARNNADCHALNPALGSSRHLDHLRIRSAGRVNREEVATVVAGG